MQSSRCHFGGKYNQCHSDTTPHGGRTDRALRGLWGAPWCAVLVGVSRHLVSQVLCKHTGEFGVLLATTEKPLRPQRVITAKGWL